MSFALGTLNGNFVIVNMLLPSSGALAPLLECGEPLARAALVRKHARPQSWWHTEALSKRMDSANSAPNALDG